MSYKLADVIWNDDGTMTTRLTNKELVGYLIDKLSKREEEYKRVMNITPDGSDALCERKIDEERDYLEYKAKNQDEYRYVKLGQLENIEDEFGIDLITFFNNYRELLSLKGRNLKISIEEVQKQLEQFDKNK